MKKVINKKTKVVKELRSEVDVAMYLATGEWELLKEEPKQNPLKLEDDK